MDLNKKIWQWLLLIALAAIWGTSFILMKRGLVSYEAEQVAGFRIFITFLVFLPWMFKYFKLLNKNNIVPLLIVGFIGNGIPAYLFATAQTEVNSSLAGMLNTLTPLFTLSAGVIFFRTKASIFNIIGIVIGLIGALGLIYKGDLNFFNSKNWYALLILVATLFYGTNINVVKNKLQNVNGVAIAALAFMFIGPIAGILLLLSDFSKAAASDEALLHLLYIAILAIFSSSIAVVVMNILIKYTTAVFASSVTYIIPVFAILWGTFDGERMSAIQIISIIVVLTGVYLTNVGKKHKGLKTNDIAIGERLQTDDIPIT